MLLAVGVLWWISRTRRTQRLGTAALAVGVVLAGSGLAMGAGPRVAPEGGLPHPEASAPAETAMPLDEALPLETPTPTPTATSPSPSPSQRVAPASATRSPSPRATTTRRTTAPAARPTNP